MPGATVWLTGLPSAGKTTLAELCAAELRSRCRPVEVLDGDELRTALSADLGFSRTDREMHVRRVGTVAHLLARNGVLVLVSVIAPFSRSRDLIRAQHRESGVAYVEVHVATPVEVCAARDVKGLYAAQQAGLIRNLTGVDDPYEIPTSPELRIDAHLKPASRCASEIVDELARRELL